MEFLSGFVAGLVVAGIVYLFRNKITTKAANELDTVKGLMAQAKKPVVPPTPKP